MANLLSTINTNVFSKANSSVLTSCYTKTSTDTLLTYYYTKIVMDDLLNTLRTNINNTNIDLTTTISNLGNKSEKSTTYTMTQVNKLLNTKLNNTTGSVSTYIKNTSGDDVAFFLN
jgi:hypothetical protein